MPNTKQVDASLFRAYDIRGRTDRSFTPEVAQLIGRAIGLTMQAQHQHTLCIAWDGRLSSPVLVNALTEGLKNSGIDVIQLGRIPTGTLYFGIHHLKLTCGLMVTGSHNPPEYNGIKIIIDNKPLADAGIQALREKLEPAASVRPVEAEGLVSKQTIEDAYVKAVRERLLPKRPLRLVVDAGNGVAGPLAIQTLTALGHQVMPLYCDIDGHFPNHHPDPSLLSTLHDLQACVQSMQADMGIALDGDGDRVWAVDEKGRILWPDRLFMRILQDWLPKNPGAKVLYDIKCTHLLEDTIKRGGGTPEICRTGHSVIKTRMKETGALLAAEMSGHYFFNSPWILADDGLYGAGWIAQWLSQQSLPLSELYDQLPETHSTPEIKIPVAEPLSPHAIIKAFKIPQDERITRVLTLDGIRIESEKGWALVRASNTTPDLTLRFEAMSKEDLPLLVEWVTKGLQSTEIDHSYLEKLVPTG